MELVFDGSCNGISVGEFIYRANALTTSSLRGDFDALCQNGHILFEGKAKNWFWRYHRANGVYDWFTFCDALKTNFKDIRTDFDIKETIRNRKQKPNESFEKFLEGVLCLCDSLNTPISERELVETLIQNLKPDIRLELLHFDISTLNDLRRACLRRKNFFETVQCVQKFPTTPFRAPVRQNSEVEHIDITEEVNDITAEISAVSDLSSRKCWNCDELGHNYKQCVKPRRVFCYGCGLIAFFLPTCPNCNKPVNARRDVCNNNSKHPKPQQTQNQN